MTQWPVLLTKKPRSGVLEKKKLQKFEIAKNGGILLVQKTSKKIIIIKVQLFFRKSKKSQEILVAFAVYARLKKNPRVQSQNPKILTKISRSGNTEFWFFNRKRRGKKLEVAR